MNHKQNKNKFKFSFNLCFIIIAIIMLFISYCGNENNNNNTETDNEESLKPYEPGVIGEVYENDAVFDKNSEDWIAIVGEDEKEIYKLDQFIEDASLYILANLNPDEAILKIDNPVFKNNIVWDIISRKLLYRKGLGEFKAFNEDFIDDTKKIMEDEGKTQYLILKEIHEPIKNYQITEADKKQLFEERKKIYNSMGIKDYKQIRNITSDYIKYYIQKAHTDMIKRLLEKYEFTINDLVVEGIKKLYTIDAMLESEYADEVILTVNGVDYKTSYFTKYLLYRLTMVYAKSFRSISLTATTMAEEIDTILQNFLSMSLKLEEYKTKNYNANEAERFINTHIESRVADVYIRKEVDNRIPPPIGSEVEQYYEEHEVTVLNYFWRYYGESASTMSEEDFDLYARSVIAETVLHDEIITNEQAKFRNYIMEENKYEPNKALLEKSLFKTLPFDKEKAKNPDNIFN